MPSDNLKTPPNNYTVVITRHAFRKLEKLPLNVRNELNKRILELENNPRPAGCKKLVNRQGENVSTEMKLRDVKNA